MSLVTISWTLHFAIVESRTDGQREREDDTPEAALIRAVKSPSHRHFLKAEPNMTHNGLTWKENSSKAGYVKAAPVMLPWTNQPQILLHPQTRLCLSYIPELGWMKSCWYNMCTVLSCKNSSKQVWPSSMHFCRHHNVCGHMCGCGLFV